MLASTKATQFLVVMLTLLFLLMSMHLSASASALRLLDPREMRELAKGANPAPPGSVCTHELISNMCTDWLAACSPRNVIDCVPGTGAVTCPSCSDTVNQDEVCTTNPKAWWTVYKCVTQADDPKGCGLHLKGAVCSWDAILGKCFCDQTAATKVVPDQDCSRRRVTYDTGCKPK